MNRFFSFTEIGSNLSFTNLGNSLGGHRSGHVIHMNPQHGRGRIQQFRFEKGLHMRHWDLLFHEPYRLHHLNSDKRPDVRGFTILYLLAPDGIVVQLGLHKKSMLLQGSMKTLLISNQTDIQFDLPAGKSITAIDITVSINWMRDQFNPLDASFIEFFDRLSQGMDPLGGLDAGSSSEFQVTSALQAKCAASPQDMLTIKSKTFTLVSDFFIRAFSQQDSDLGDGKHVHQERMAEVEKILLQYLDKSLPSIEELARVASMSASSLKRHFKMMYGKSIYEYYLEKKMDYAKRLLIERPLSVKEVAFQIGYEKPSNFIKMFKKYYNFSPGQLKRM